MFRYIVKYCNKTEKKTKLYEVLTYNLLSCISHHIPFISFVLYLINKLVSKRDWTIQKVYHHLLNLFLMESSYIVLDIDYCLPGSRSQSTIINEKKIYKTINIYEKYTACNIN